MDAVGDRDYIVEFLFWASLLSTHLRFVLIYLFNPVTYSSYGAFSNPPFVSMEYLFGVAFQLSH